MKLKKKKQPVKSVRKLLPAPSLHSGVRIFALSVWLRFRHLATSIHLVLLGVAAYFILSSAFTASFFVPRTVNFSFGGNNCITSPTLLPNFISVSQGETFSATPKSSVSIAGYPLYSHTTCITPTQAPIEKVVDTISLKPLDGPLKKTIRVQTPEFPQLAYQDALGVPLPTKNQLILPFNTPDRVFEYRLIANDKTVDCTKTNKTLVCDISKLGLRHSATYDFVLQRLYPDFEPQTVFSRPVTTVGAVLVTGASVAHGQTIIDVPTAITLTLNKPAASFEGAQLSQVSGDARQQLPVTTALTGQTMTFTLTKPLARSASFELSVQNIIAPDGGHLPDPFIITFATSGGPKVKGANIGSYKVATSANIVLYFDAPLSSSQNLSQFIKIEINGVAAPASVTRSGSTVIINPSDTLPKCTSFTVRVADGLENQFGIGGGSAWSYTSRTLCQTVFSIGTSVKNRGITAYRFGTGNSYVVFVGGTHGNEKSSVYALNSLIDYLEKNYGDIPAHRSVVVIPNLNPDGFAVTSRTNANNVDLNRNFPANNWKQGVTMPDQTFNPNGGGNAPLSEPESSSLASYVLGLNPRLVLTYHAAAGVVIPNDSDDSDALAKIYDQKSNLGYESNNQTGQIFAYDTTGAFEDWLHDKHGIPALLIELWTTTGNEFSRNQNAMLHMIQLP